MHAVCKCPYKYPYFLFAKIALVFFELTYESIRLTYKILN